MLRNRENVNSFNDDKCGWRRVAASIDLSEDVGQCRLTKVTATS